jgi:hypothetical protein
LHSGSKEEALRVHEATHALFTNGEYGGLLGVRQHKAQWQELADSLRLFGPENSVAAWKTVSN